MGINSVWRWRQIPPFPIVIVGWRDSVTAWSHQTAKFFVRANFAIAVLQENWFLGLGDTRLSMPTEALIDFSVARRSL